MKTIIIKNQKEYDNLPKNFRKGAEIFIYAHLKGETIIPSNCNVIIEEEGEIDFLAGGEIAQNKGTIIHMKYGKVSINEGYILEFFSGKVHVNQGVIVDFFGGHLAINKKGIPVRSNGFDEQLSGIKHFRGGFIGCEK